MTDFYKRPRHHWIWILTNQITFINTEWKYCRFIQWRAAICNSWAQFKDSKIFSTLCNLSNIAFKETKLTILCNGQFCLLKSNVWKITQCGKIHSQKNQNNVHYIRLRNVNKAEPTLTLKPRGDVTRNPKQGYQWPQKKDICVRQKLLKIQTNKNNNRLQLHFKKWRCKNNIGDDEEYSEINYFLTVECSIPAPHNPNTYLTDNAFTVVCLQHLLQCFKLP